MSEKEDRIKRHCYMVANDRAHLCVRAYKCMNPLDIECPTCTEPAGVDCVGIRASDSEGFCPTKKTPHAARVMEASSVDRYVIIDTEDRYVVVPSSTEADTPSDIVVEYRGPSGWAVTRNGHELNHNHEWVRVDEAFKTPGDFRWTRPAAVDAANRNLFTSTARGA